MDRLKEKLRFRRINRYIFFAWIVVVVTFLVGCATVEKSYKHARMLDTIPAYEEFVKSYPESPYTSDARERLNTLKEEATFREVELKNSIIAYRKFIHEYPHSRFIEVAKKRIAETDEAAFIRTIHMGTIQAFHGFTESYPDSKYISEVRDYIQWLERMKIGVVVNISEGETEKDRIESELSHRLTAFLEKLGREVVFLKSPDDVGKEKLSAVIDINYNQYETNPERTGKAVGAFISGGLVGYLLASGQGTLGPPNIVYEGWIVDIKSGGVREDVKYKREMQSENFDKILTDTNFLIKVGEAEMITWITKRDEPPVVFIEQWVVALKYNDPSVRKSAAYVLGEIKYSRAVDPLIVALRDEDPGVRWEVLRALGKIKDPRAIKLLIDAIKDGSDIRWQAAKALGEIGAPAVEPLIDTLKDERSDVRWQAAETLGKIKDPRAIEPLIIALRDKEPSVRWVVASALEEINDPRAVEPLIIALRDEDPGVRQEAAKALGEIKDPRAVEPLIAALNDKNPHVREIAVGSLRNITGQNFGENPAQWQKWWEKNKDRF